ncbi:MAG: hypothetical protein INR69_00010 [Mucilaginibacter polytrichastri]|nr:hypothetical protein [Mucilaginibacter polytrichastri]
MLFDDFDRTDTDRNNFSVERYTFLNNSAIPEAASARAMITSWSEGFLIKPDFVRKFRSKNNKQHTAALFELFVFNYFKSQGFPIENIDVAGVPTPDFKIETEKGIIYIECTCASRSGHDESIEALQSVILDSFAKLEKRNNFVNIDWLQCSYTTPSMKRIRFLIQQFINDPQKTSCLMIEESGWRIKITLINSGKPVQRGVGFMMYPVGIITPQVNILTALEEKRPTRYKIDDQYIIAVHSDDPFLDDLDIELALFDGAVFQDTLPLGRANENALYIADKKLINRSVSAVLTVQKLNIYHNGQPRMKLWHHPEPKYPIDPSLFLLRQKTFERLDENNFKAYNLEIRI